MSARYAEAHGSGRLRSRPCQHTRRRRCSTNAASSTSSTALPPSNEAILVAHHGEARVATTPFADAMEDFGASVDKKLSVGEVSESLANWVGERLDAGRGPMGLVVAGVEDGPGRAVARFGAAVTRLVLGYNPSALRAKATARGMSGGADDPPVAGGADEAIPRPRERVPGGHFLGLPA
ncbi:MAG: hypothetical protein M0035_10165 [Actinomycetota bacterium]|nr:hypothetical protein [Actinomycetota bacterium]